MLPPYANTRMALFWLLRPTTAAAIKEDLKLAVENSLVTQAQMDADPVIQELHQLLDNIMEFKHDGREDK